MPRKALGSAFLIAAGSLGLARAQEQPPDLGWVDLELVAGGETVLRTGKDGNAVTIDVATRIDAPKEAIWAVLRACDVAPEYVPNIVACRRIDTVNEGKSELFVQTVKPAFFVPRFEHVFRLDYFPYTRIEVHRVSGPIAEMDGTWWLLDQEDGAVLLVYSLRLQPGFPVPRFFVRSTLRRDVPTVLEAVRTRAEAHTGPL
jgi:hypothetical protein